MIDHIKWIIKEYQHKIETLEEVKKESGIIISNALSGAKMVEPQESEETDAKNN